MKNYIILCFSVSLLLVACTNTEVENKNSTANADNGKMLFEKNCALCHALQTNASTGMAPVLNAVKEHWKNEEELIDFIKNNKSFTGNKEHVTALRSEWDAKTQMPLFEGLTAQELEDIVAYIR